ncbi:Uncharacterised protein [Bordetella pertussis]|nr:Uncharacterised protein [Bordetella pertussis]CFP64034.1 Uncharacterised protein [Bordetella pertussis]
MRSSCLLVALISPSTSRTTCLPRTRDPERFRSLPASIDTFAASTEVPA